jgi:hypothetical protein
VLPQNVQALDLVQRASPIDRWRLGQERTGGLVPAGERWAHDVHVPEFEIDAQAVSWARLVECSEQCACLCEAAHTPLVWATQVMEQCVKTGVPSRAEVADVALGSRAEAFMLNKGGHVVEAMGLLDEIHRRMAGHEHKHRNLLRRLRLCD